MKEQEKKQPDYGQLIFSWYKKSTEEDYFSKFIFLYLAFDASLRKRFFINSRNDREAIDSLKGKEKIKLIYFEEMKKDRELEATFEALIRELNREPLKNTSRNNGEITEIKITNKEDWKNLIEFIYIIRNNLFHGEKSPEEFRDWNMVYYAYKLLKPLVEIMISYQARNLDVYDYDIEKLKEMREHD